MLKPTQKASSAPPQVPSAKLQQQTAKAHQQIEVELHLAHALSSYASYANVLKKLRAVVSPADQVIDKYLTLTDPWFTNRRKASWIEADLDWLASHHLVSEAEQVQHFPKADFSWIDNSFAAAGLLFMLEETSLSAVYQAEQIRLVLGLVPGSGATYLGGYGEATQTHWQEATRWLDTKLADASDCQIAGKAARRAIGQYAAVMKAASTEKPENGEKTGD